MKINCQGWISNKIYLQVSRTERYIAPLVLWLPFPFPLLLPLPCSPSPLPSLAWLPLGFFLCGWLALASSAEWAEAGVLTTPPAAAVRFATTTRGRLIERCPWNASIHHTVPLPGGRSHTTGLYPFACEWVPRLLKIWYLSLHCESDRFNIFTFPKYTLFQGPLLCLYSLASYPKLYNTKADKQTHCLVFVFQIAPLLFGLFGS